MWPGTTILPVWSRDTKSLVSYRKVTSGSVTKEDFWKRKDLSWSLKEGEEGDGAEQGWTLEEGDFTITKPGLYDVYCAQRRIRRTVWLDCSSINPFFVWFHLPLVPLTAAAYLNLQCQTQCQVGVLGLQMLILHLISWAVSFTPNLIPPRWGCIGEI